MAVPQAPSPKMANLIGMAKPPAGGLTGNCAPLRKGDETAQKGQEFHRHCRDSQGVNQAKFDACEGTRTYSQAEEAWIFPSLKQRPADDGGGELATRTCRTGFRFSP